MDASSMRTDKTSRPELDDTFFEIARALAERSTCPDGARHGCVITVDNRVIATGYGSPGVGVPPCERCWLREKYAETGVKDWSVCPSIHAEANAVACAARNGVSTRGAVAWVTRAPCERCRVLLLSAGIERVHWPLSANSSKKNLVLPSEEIQISLAESSKPTEQLKTGPELQCNCHECQERRRGEWP
jgi:dCMP deaminase